MDVLSEVLKAVKLTGVLFYNAEFSAPWCFCSPASRMLAPSLSSDLKHMIIFPLVTEGCGYAHIEGNDQSLPLNAGGIIIVPRGDPHAMRNGPYIKPVDQVEQVRQVLAQGLNVVRMGGSGEVTKFIRGSMTCEPQLSQVFIPRGTAADIQGQYPRRRVGPVAGNLSPLFGGSCGCRATGRRSRAGQTLGSVIHRNTSALYYGAAAGPNRVAGRGLRS